MFKLLAGHWAGIALLIGSTTSQVFADTVTYRVDINETRVNFTGTPTSAISLNGSVPGPTLEARVGDTFQVTFVNHMDTETSIHWHGVLLPNDQDGVPYLTTQPIAANSEFSYEFPIAHHGTYWYHSHTGLQEQRGVYGALVFHPEKERVAASREQVLVFSDWTDENPNQVMRHLKRDDDYYALKKDKVQSWDKVIAHGGDAIRNRLGSNWMRMGPMDLSDVGYDAFLVNGQPETTISSLPTGERLRLRLINASASTYQHVQFSAGPMQIVAADGIDVEPLWVDELTMAVAETYDLIVSIPDHRQYELRASAVDGTGYSSTWLGSHGERVFAQDYVAPNPYLAHHDHQRMDAMEQNADQPSVSGMAHKHAGADQDTDIHQGSMPMTEEMHAGMTMMRADMNENRSQPSLGHYENLRALTPIETRPDQPVREVLLRLTGSMDGYRWSFNDQPLSAADRILISRGERVRFVLKNETMMSHPIHLHGHFFRVITDQGAYSPLKHTVNVPNMETVVIEFDADMDKDWIFHCHNLYHMKAGMSRVVRYDDYQGDATLPSTVGKVMSADNDYWAFADIGLMSNVADISAWMFNNRHQWEIEAEHDWEEMAEIDASYAYRFDNFTQAFIGIDAEREDDETDSLVVAGIRYLLPGMIDAELRVDDQGDTRLQLEAEIRLSKHSELAWHWNSDNEYGASWSYEPDKRWALILNTDSDFETGAGVELRF